MSTISPEQLDQLRIGMSADELHALLGPPNECVDARAAVAPSKVFAELGSTFRFEDRNVDTVWTYSDSRRRRMIHCLGIQKGRLVAIWRVTLRQSWFDGGGK